MKKEKKNILFQYWLQNQTAEKKHHLCDESLAKSFTTIKKQIAKWPWHKKAFSVTIQFILKNKTF